MRDMCDICGKNQAMHERGDGKKYCCECHVKSGAAPADWHPLCMKTYMEIKGIKGASDDYPIIPQ